MGNGASVRLHTLNRPPARSEVREIAGVSATSPERTIADCLETGTQLEQIELAVAPALERGTDDAAPPATCR